jgi:pyruvate-ferredoxin/flavodoxin oxidoreductase
VGQPPLLLDSPPAKVDVLDYMRNESRFRMVEKESPERYAGLVERARQVTRERDAVYRYLAGLTVPAPSGAEPAKERGTDAAPPEGGRPDAVPAGH